MHVIRLMEQRSVPASDRKTQWREKLPRPKLPRCMIQHEWPSPKTTTKHDSAWVAFAASELTSGPSSASWLEALPRRMMPLPTPVLKVLKVLLPTVLKVPPPVLLPTVLLVPPLVLVVPVLDQEVVDVHPL